MQTPANISNIIRQSEDLQLHAKTVNLKNQRFGRLLVVSFSSYKIKGAYWLCECECGKKKEVLATYLKSSKVKSCGCIEGDRKKSGHGLTQTSFYRIWGGMVKRCINPKAKGYKYYGGRGISVCDSWLTFHNFYTDMYQTYLTGLSIERINNDGNYCKENCKWATQKEQTQNKSNTIKFNIGGLVGTISQWVEISGTSRRLIESRYARGWSAEDCVYGRNKTVSN